MFINESIDTNDSAIFMGFMRQSLIESLKDNHAEDSMIKYVEESASDSQVLSLAMYGKSCPQDNQVFAETFLMSQLKDYMIENVNEFDFSADYSVVNFMQEIGGLSLVDSDSLTIISEGISNGIDASIKNYEKNKGKQVNLKNLKSGFKNLVDKNNPTNKKIDNFGTKLGNKVIPDKAPSNVKAHNPTLDAVNDAEAGSNTSDMGGVGKEIAKNEEAGGNRSDMGGVGKEIAKNEEAGGNIFDKIKGFGDNIGKAWSTFTGFVNKYSGNNAKAIGITALVAASAFIAYKTYKNYFSKAAKACAGKSGAEKAACMAKAKQGAVKSQIAAYKKSMSACKSTNNVAACKKKYQSKISSLQAKLN